MSMLGGGGNSGNERLDPEARRRLVEVCLASPLFPPDYSGAGVRFSRYAPGLLERGIRLHVVAAEVGRWRPDPADQGRGERKDTPSNVWPHLAVDRVPLPRGASRSRKRRAYEAGVLDRCQTGSRRPDVLINLSRGSLRALLRLRRTGVPVVYVQTMHDPPAEATVKARLSRNYSRLRYALTDQIVVSSGAMRDELRSLGVRTPVEVIPHGVDLSRFSPDRSGTRAQEIRGRLGLPSESELVVFVGRISARKGLEHLGSAWDQIADSRPEAHLLLIGPEEEGADGAPDSFGGRLRARFAKGVGPERVRFVGPVQDVEAYLQAADVFVFPSHREGMPNVVGEAFGCGTACVLTPFLGLSKEFGREDAEYVLVDHEGARIGAEVSRLLADPARRQEMGAAARRWAERELSLEGSLDRYAEVLRDLAFPGTGGKTDPLMEKEPVRMKGDGGAWT